MEFILLEHIVAELQQQLVPAVVSKIYQPDADLLIFKLWNGRENQRLLLSVEAQNSRIHLTWRDWLNPDRPPRFCQLLRARIARIESLALVNRDRIVQLDCQGERGPCRLVVELTGKTGNMILTDADGSIIDALHRDRGGRELLSGQSYLPPENKGKRPDDMVYPELGTFENWSRYVEEALAGTKELSPQEFHKQLQNSVAKHKKKLLRRLADIETEMAQQENAETFKQKGDLLLANRQRLKRGMTGIEVVDYFSQEAAVLRIELDPVLTPQENVERYYKRHRKLTRGIDHSLRRYEETQSELEWLGQLEYQLNSDLQKADLEDIAEELREMKILREKTTLHQRRTTSAAKPNETTSPSGLRVIWGRSNRQNDAITTRILKPGDLWYHAKGIPGSHVVLKSSEQQTFSEADRLFAASIAAGYSKGRNDTKVEVIEAEAKSVKKSKGYKPGMVSVKEFNSIYVEPYRSE